MPNQNDKSIGALWKRKSEAKGITYLKGYVEVNNVKTEIVVFSVKNKKSDKAADFQILESQPFQGKTGSAPKKEAPKSDGFDL